MAMQEVMYALDPRQGEKGESALSRAAPLLVLAAMVLVTFLAVLVLAAVFPGNAAVERVVDVLIRLLTAVGGGYIGWVARSAPGPK